MALPVLHPELRGCDRCLLHTQCKSPGIGWRWDSRSLPWRPNGVTLALVGQNPGFNEDQQGEPFIGLSGNILLGGAELPMV